VSSENFFIENHPDRLRWNKRYQEEFDLFDKNPSEIVMQYYKIANIGKALDIACGLGRNSIFLAEKGFIVDAVDISDIALKNIKHQNIKTYQADLSDYKIEKESYDLIININFVERRLFPHIKDGLKKDGVLIFETFLEGSPQTSNKPYLLKKNELLHSFLSLQIIFYQEKEVITHKNEKAYKASLVAVKRC